ncbi:hypothetical protein [Psychrobacter glacincola]|uniref:hypothetical protein n=1 Tax=Psychrobacter glacincola TaxID=56810 RepID=UPI003CFD1195
MDEKLRLEELISDDVLCDIKDILLDVYEQTEKSTATENDDNYTSNTTYSGRLLNAINRYVHSSDLLENLTRDRKTILRVLDSSLYLRVLSRPLNEYQRRKNTSDIYEEFDLNDGNSLNHNLFGEFKETKGLKFGFLYTEKNTELDGIAYVRFQAFDEAWRPVVEWSSDSVQNKITFSLDTFNEKSKELPKAKLLESGSDVLKPVIPVDSNIDDANG